MKALVSLLLIVLMVGGTTVAFLDNYGGEALAGGPPCIYDENGTVCADQSPPGGEKGILDVPIPDHPAVPWTMFGITAFGIFARTGLIPIINAVKR